MRSLTRRLTWGLPAILWALTDVNPALSQDAGLPAPPALSRQLYDVVRREPDFPSGTQYIYARYATWLPQLAQALPKDTTRLAEILALQPTFGSAATPSDISPLLPSLGGRLIDSMPTGDDRSTWATLREHFGADVHIVELSQVSTDSGQTRAVVVVNVSCGKRCENRSTTYRMALTEGHWVIVSRLKVFE